MRHITGLMIVAALLGGCSSEAQPVPAEPPTERTEPPSPTSALEPDLAACPKAEAIEARIRTKRIPVPAALEGMAVSSLDHFAFATADGSTVCVDTTWFESISDAKLSDDGRFASFGWLGYEAFGHVIVDRSGKGQVVDTGSSPAWSPRGERLAAVDLSESGFGSLNAFAVWEVRPAGLRQIAEVSEAPPSGDWRIDGWRGEGCVSLSLVPSDRYPEDYRDLEKTPRDPWFATEANGWRPSAGSCPRS